MAKSAVALLPHILDSGVKIMMFAGEEDLICNYKGIERSIANLNWGGAVGFSNVSPLIASECIS
jgi:carboxypeptidase D